MPEIYFFAYFCLADGHVDKGNVLAGGEDQFSVGILMMIAFWLMLGGKVDEYDLG